MAAFRRAVELGADAIELDVRLSRDGVPMVIHDPTLDRTTAATGPVSARTADELARLKVGSTTGVPRLEEVLREIALPILLEVKEPGAQEAVAGVLLRTGGSRPRGRGVRARRGARCLPRAPFLVGASARDILRLWLAPLRGLPELRCVAYSVPWRHRGVLPVPTRRFVADAHALGASVHVWTVDEPALACRLWKRGVSGIVTNDPGRLVSARPGPA